MKLIGVCREDPERKRLPIVKHLTKLTLDIVKCLFEVMKKRQFQSKWNRLQEYFEMLSDIGIDERH